MERALITGITGFAGSHLAELLLTQGFEVHGIKRPRSRTENIAHIEKDLVLREADIRDSSSMGRTIREISPRYIFHLAAQTYVPLSWEAPEETLTTNLMGTLNVLEAVREGKLDTVIQVAGSSEEYGKVLPEETPITEDNDLRPMSQYGVSKVAADMLARQYHMSFGLQTVVTRAFNHTGPRRGDVFATSNFAKQIVEIERGKKDPIIRVGNLEAIRDFTDARDTVKGYLLAVEKCKYGDVYNICSGNGVRIGDMLNTLLNLSDVEIKVQQEESRMRPSDVPLLYGDYTKFKEKTGWQPIIPFVSTMRDLLDYWRERV